MKSAQSGDVVFVKGNANIDLAGTLAYEIHGDVILTSDRGSSGSQGGTHFFNTAHRRRA